MIHQHCHRKILFAVAKWDLSSACLPEDSKGCILMLSFIEGAWEIMVLVDHMEDFPTPPIGRVSLHLEEEDQGSPPSSPSLQIRELLLVVLRGKL